MLMLQPNEFMTISTRVISKLRLVFQVIYRSAVMVYLRVSLGTLTKKYWQLQTGQIVSICTQNKKQHGNAKCWNMC